MKEDRLETFTRQAERLVDQLLYSREPQETSSFFPSHIHIEPTNACNLRCIHCHHHPGSRKAGKFTRKLGMMEMGLYRRVLEQIVPHGCAISLNCQGEPTLHRDIVEMVALAKAGGLHVSLLTNGTRLDEALTERLLAAGLDRIVFSFDALEKELYEAIRVRGDFDSTFANINRFIDLNHDRGHPVFVCMSIVVQDRTREHLPRYRAYFEQRPIDTIFESMLLNLSGNTATADRFDLSTDDTPGAGPICRVPWENLVINWDGQVTICPLDFDGKWIAGDARSTPLEEIWNSEIYRHFRQAHLMHDLVQTDKNGAFCGKCSCRRDPEYDLRNYAAYAKQALVRAARRLMV